MAEASLDAPSGQIVIARCIDYFPDAKRLPVAPGSYRIQVYYGGLDTLSKDGLQEGCPQKNLRISNETGEQEPVFPVSLEMRR